MNDRGTYVQNRILTFIYFVFSLYDRRVPVSEILPLIAETDLEMIFPSFQKIISHEGFTSWYNSGGIISNSYNVKVLSATQNDTNSYEVKLYVSWQARTNEGVKSMSTFQKWLIIDGGDYWPR